MPHATDPLAVHFRQRTQQVKPANAVPNPVSGQIRAQKLQGIAQNGVFAAAQIIASPACGRVPELAPFRLTDRVVGQDDKTPFRQVRMQNLMFGIGLANVRVAAGADHAGARPFSP